MEKNDGTFGRDPYGYAAPGNEGDATDTQPAYEQAEAAGGQAPVTGSAFNQNPYANQGYDPQAYTRPNPYGQQPYPPQGYPQQPQQAYDPAAYRQPQAYDPAAYQQPQQGYPQQPAAAYDRAAYRAQRGYQPQQQGYDPAAYQQPQQAYDPAAYQQPQQAYDPAAYQQPQQGYDPAAYQQPQQGYDPAAYQQPQQGYDPAAYQQAQQGYDPAAYQQPYARQPYAPQYGQQGYQQPAYGEPSAYGAAEHRDAKRNDYDEEPYERDGNTTGRRRVVKSSYDDAHDFDYDGEDDYDERDGDDGEPGGFAAFLHGIGDYLTHLPTKTLIIFGGSIAVLLVAVILLVVLLPGNKAPDAPQQGGQLALADITFTPSLPPTLPPEPTPVPTDTPDPDPLNGIKISTVGELNDAIPAVQQRLVELGYMTMPADGYTNKYGPATKTAIRLFQIKNFEDKKDWDGILGSGTYVKLMSDDASAYYLARGDGDERTKEITKLVQDVTNLQNRLITLGYMTGSATGVYGSSTVTAVQTFQQYHGITPFDGIAGQKTLTALYAADAMDAATGKLNDRSKLSPSPDVPSVTGDTTTTTDVPAASPAV